jgi:hypothetical protein
MQLGQLRSLILAQLWITLAWPTSQMEVPTAWPHASVPSPLDSSGSRWRAGPVGRSHVRAAQLLRRRVGLLSQVRHLPPELCAEWASCADSAIPDDQTTSPWFSRRSSTASPLLDSRAEPLLSSPLFPVTPLRKHSSAVRGFSAVAALGLCWCSSLECRSGVVAEGFCGVVRRSGPPAPTELLAGAWWSTLTVAGTFCDTSRGMSRFIAFI